MRRRTVWLKPGSVGFRTTSKYSGPKSAFGFDASLMILRSNEVNLDSAISRRSALRRIELRPIPKLASAYVLGGAPNPLLYVLAAHAQAGAIGSYASHDDEATDEARGADQIEPAGERRREFWHSAADLRRVSTQFWQS